MDCAACRLPAVRIEPESRDRIAQEIRRVHITAQRGIHRDRNGLCVGRVDGSPVTLTAAEGVPVCKVDDVRATPTSPANWRRT